MKNIKFLLVGILFGIILTKAEAISWYRMYEMFKFQSFHMYGLFGTAVFGSLILMQLFKRGIIKDYQGNKIVTKEKKKGLFRPLVGGTIFGLGWALAGACPAPVFILIGNGVLTVLVVLLGCLLGAFILGLVEKKMP